MRNGVVHAGLVDSTAHESVLDPFLRACDHLLAAMPEPGRGVFWGELEDLVDVRLSESARAAELLVAEAITAARLVFNERFSPLDGATRKAVLAWIRESYAPTKYEQTLITCPACSQDALVSGSYDVDWEPEWEIRR